MNRMSAVHVSFCWTLMTYSSWTRSFIFYSNFTPVSILGRDRGRPAFAVFQRSHRKEVSQIRNDKSLASYRECLGKQRSRGLDVRSEALSIGRFEGS
jgi:hypothetical protein